MASKTVEIYGVKVWTKVADDQFWGRGTPDCYLLVKSQFSVAGDRKQVQKNTQTPAFPNPYVVTVGNPSAKETVDVELWDHDGGDQWNDDLVESVRLSLDAEPEEGTKTFTMSKGGEITLSWKVKGRQLNPETPPAKVTFTSVRASSLRPMDGRNGKVDPYVILTGRSGPAHASWDTQPDTVNPVWQDPKTVPYDPHGYEVQVWDSDTFGDDLCGSGFAKLNTTLGSVDIQLRFTDWLGSSMDAGSVKLEFFAEGLPPAPAAPAAGEAPAGPQIVTRKEIRKMTKPEATRFVKALKQTMKNKSGPQTSEYFRIAGYHGWPSDYCNHGQETFPGWHRGYLVDLEQALQKADKELGGDGNIALPYWDWTTLDIGGQCMPKIIRDEFKALPKDFLKKGEAGQLGTQGYSGIRNEAALKSALEQSRVAFAAGQCLQVAEHYMHASTRFNRQGYPVEAPHNSVHMAAGFPMTSLQYAAFHPIFFLHHCNVDRIYEKHLQIETVAESMEEFRLRQQQLARRGDTNRFAQPLVPFKHPFTGADLMPADTGDCKLLGYQYDELPNVAMQEREDPTFVAFTKINVMEISTKSYMLYCFVMPKADAAKWKRPGDKPEAYPKDKYFGGAGAIFGGKEAKCHNCMEREPYNVLVEVQEALLRLKLSRHDAAVKVVTIDEYGQVKNLEETQIKPPVLVGPMFEDLGAPLAPDAAKESGEVGELQRFLAAMGCDPGALDGKFGPKTEAAVKKMQEFLGLEQDGVVSADMKKKLSSKRVDQAPDVASPAKAGSATITEGSTVLYTVGEVPGYLKREQALSDIADAFKQWGEAMGVKYAYTSSGLKAKLRVDFEDLAGAGEELSGGVARQGGQLAEATRYSVKLDAAERWLLKGQEVPAKYPKAVTLFSVLLHEIGHTIGLSHSSNPEDVMYPYHKEGTGADLKLSAGDMARAKARVAPAPVEEAPAAEAAAAEQEQEPAPVTPVIDTSASNNACVQCSLQ